MKILLAFLLCFSIAYASHWVEPYIQGELAVRNKEYDKAFELYQTSISNDPTQAFPYLGAAQVYLERGDYVKAREALDNAKKAKEGFDHEVVQKYRMLMMSLFARMGDMDTFKIYHDEFMANSYDIPRTYRENDKIFIFNAPKSEWFRKTIESATRKYEEVEEVTWYDDIAIFKLKS